MVHPIFSPRNSVIFNIQQKCNGTGILGLFHQEFAKSRKYSQNPNSCFTVHTKHLYIIQLNYPGVFQSTSNCSAAKVIVTLISSRLLLVSSISSFSSANTSLCFCNSFLMEFPSSFISFNSSSNLADVDSTVYSLLNICVLVQSYSVIFNMTTR